MNEVRLEVQTLWRYRELMKVLTWREIRGRTAGSAGGWIWLWLPPLLVIASYILVFDFVFRMPLRADVGTQRVGAFLAVGMLAWLQFVDATQRGMNSLLEAGELLKKNPLPAMVFPTRSVAASALIHAPLFVLMAAGYSFAYNFRVGVFAVPLLFLLQIVLCLCISCVLSIFAVALRDTVQIVGVCLSLGVFLSPILFPVDLFPPAGRWLLWLNPMTGLVLGYQAALLRGAWPVWQVWVATAVWIFALLSALNVLLRRSRELLVDWI